MARKRDDILERIRSRQQRSRESRQRIVRYPTELPRAERVLELIDDASIKWYALLIVPQRESAAQEILARKGIISYCPMDFRWRKRNKFAVDKELFSFPMMPGWVFVGMTKGKEPWHAVFTLRLVRAVIGHDGRPLAIPSDAMTSMVAKFRNGVVRPEEEKFMRTNKEFKVDDMVRITQGPLRSFEAKVVEIDGAVAKVMFSMFGVSKPVEVSTETLEPAA